MSKVDYKIIAQVVANKISESSSDKVAKDLAAYLVAERRAADLDKIMREVERIRLQQAGVLEVNVASAHELTSEIEAKVQQLFESKKTIINKQIDQSLVGGVKIQAQDTLIDLSVRGQLNQLKSI